MKLTKAYKNHAFLMSDEARSVRILSEYLEPQARLRRAGVHRGVIFFGSARVQPGQGNGPDYFAAAADLAERLARWTLNKHDLEQRYFICTGGGPGIMEAAHEGAARVDRHLNVGFNISLPFEQNVNPHVEPDLAFEFHYFFMRKFWFMNLARGLVIFPGGFGTFDELFEVLTLRQTNKAPRMPIVMFGKEFWDETLNLQALARRGLISPEDLDLMRVTDDVEDAASYLTATLEQTP
jgi:uncharacterized protein (TIGR00730 family)